MKKYNEMKTENEELKGKVQSLRHNENSIQDQIDRAVREAVSQANAAKDAEHAVEIASLKLKNVKLSTVKVKSDELASYKELVKTLSADLEESKKANAELEAKMKSVKAMVA